MTLLRRRNAKLPERQSGLAEKEWNLLGGIEKIPDWQYLAMLNYEYARCCQSIVKDVAGYRKSGDGSKLAYPFARFLTRFPEFPKKPWSEIPKTERIAHLKQIGITEETRFYPTPPPWLAWSMNDDEAETRYEESPVAQKQYWGVFQIDFSQDDELIAEGFGKWLEQYRKELPKIKRNQEKETPSGRGHKKRKCEDHLKVLGGLRALRSAKDEVSAETMTDDLYRETHSWERARLQAGELFARFLTAWRYSPHPFDPFGPFNTHAVFPPLRLKLGMPNPDKIPLVRRQQVQQILDADFVLTHLQKSPF